MKYKAFIFISLLGCQSSVFTLKIEDEFTEDELDIIHSSIEEWKLATDSADADIFITYDLHDNDNELTYSEWEKERSFSPLWRINKNDEAYTRLVLQQGKGFKGVAAEGLRIGLVPESIDKDSESLKATMLHELGHFYGIHHLSSGLMAGNGIDIECIDWRALAEFCDLYYCGPKASPTCK